MVELTNALPRWLGIILAMTLTSGLGVLVYWASERYIGSRADDAAHRLGSILFPVMTIFMSLILSLAFDDVGKEWRDVQDTISREATAMADVFNSLEAYGTESSSEAAAALLHYAERVTQDDWPALEDDRLSLEADAAFRQVVAEVFALDTADAVQTERKAAILEDLDSISDARQERLIAAFAQPPPFLLVILSAILISMTLLGLVVKPTPTSMGLSVLYLSFVGLILYLVLAMSDPLHGGLSIDPAQLEDLIQLSR